MESYFTTTLFLKNSSTVEFSEGSATFKDDLNLATVMVPKNVLLEAIADYLSKQNAETLARFVYLFAPLCLKAEA